MIELKTILLIVILAAPFIGIAIAIFGIPAINPFGTYTKWSTDYISVMGETGARNPFVIKTNLAYDYRITNMVDFPVSKIKFMFTSGMEQFIFTSKGNVTIVELEHNYHEINLENQFDVLKKSGDILELEIKIVSDFYTECTITIQGGVA